MDEGKKLTRRRLLAWLGLAGLLGVLAGVLQGCMRFLRPPVGKARLSVVVAGPPGDFAPGTLTPLPQGRVLVGRDDGGLYALSAICPHLGCIVVPDGRGGLTCLCHGSTFSGDGTNLSGPAPRPLTHLLLTLNGDGLVEVNLLEEVEAPTRLL